MKTGRLMLLVLVAGALAPLASQAEYYRYVTRDGDVFYVDDLSRVPEQYRDQIKVYREPNDDLSEQEKKRLRQIEMIKERKARAEQQQSERINQKKSLETGVRIVSNQILVPVTIEYGYIEYDVLLLLDTGATNIVLHADFANTVNIGLREKNVSRLAGGGLIPTERSQIDALKLGPYVFNEVSVTIINHSGPPTPYQGLLGMNVLRQTRYSIDFDNSIIRWQPE